MQLVVKDIPLNSSVHDHLIMEYYLFLNYTCSEYLTLAVDMVIRVSAGLLMRFTE